MININNNSIKLIYMQIIIMLILINNRKIIFQSMQLNKWAVVRGCGVHDFLCFIISYFLFVKMITRTFLCKNNLEMTFLEEID
jgi:hypothetical protein